MKNSIPFFSFDKRNDQVRKVTFQRFKEFFDSKHYVNGIFTKQFEERFANYTGVKHAVGLSTGLDALHLALRALDIGPGDEVIVPSNTYIASVLSISYTGATPVFVEPRLETANINPQLILKAITSRTKAIMPVHLYGQACEMKAIMEIAENNNLFLVEDNAQAQGAECYGKKTGSFGHINATSFYPTKNLGALGEAGAITTNTEEYAQAIASLRNYGSTKRYYNDEIGYNNRIDEFEAAFLDIALNNLEDWNQERNNIANLYREELKIANGIELFELAEGSTSVHHLFVIRTPYRDQLRSHLEREGVGTQIHYPIPPHLQKAYNHLGYKKGSFPIAEELANTILSLPIWPGLKKEQVLTIFETISEFEIA